MPYLFDSNSFACMCLIDICHETFKRRKHQIIGFFFWILKKFFQLSVPQVLCGLLLLCTLAPMISGTSWPKQFQPEAGFWTSKAGWIHYWQLVKTMFNIHSFYCIRSNQLSHIYIYTHMILKNHIYIYICMCVCLVLSQALTPWMMIFVGPTQESCSTSERKVCQTACGPWQPCAGASVASEVLVNCWGPLWVLFIATIDNYRYYRYYRYYYR